MPRSTLAVAGCIASVLVAAAPLPAAADDCAGLRRQVATARSQATERPGSRSPQQIAQLQAAADRACANASTTKRGRASANKAVAAKPPEPASNDFFGGIASFFFGGGTAEPAKTGTKGLTRLETDKTRREAPPRASSGGPATIAAGGSYRTLCVRLCDGFYFPVSDRASSDGFAEDEALCAARCPGTDTALYAHRIGSEAETMVSVAGAGAYVDLPTAFLYRTRVDAACACGKITIAASPPATVDPAPPTGVIVTGEVTETGEAIYDVPPDPLADAGVDAAAVEPATLIVEPAPPQASTPELTTETAAEPATERAPVTEVLRVRKVGPTYLPGQ